MVWVIGVKYLACLVLRCTLISWGMLDGGLIVAVDYSIWIHGDAVTGKFVCFLFYSILVSAVA